MNYFDSSSYGEIDTRELFYKTFTWLFIGLMVSGVTAYGASLIGGALISWPAFIVFSLVELLMVIFVPGMLGEMSVEKARIFFLAFSFIDGLTLSVVFLMYQLNSILTIFFVAAGIFGVMSVYGYYTQADFERIGPYLIFSLVGCIISLIINIIIRNTMLDIVISIVIIITIMGCTAWDIQKMKSGKFKFVMRENAYIYFALSLYLDFINIFLNLLSLFGKKK